MHATTPLRAIAPAGRGAAFRRVLPAAGVDLVFTLAMLAFGCAHGEAQAAGAMTSGIVYFALRRWAADTDAAPGLARSAGTIAAGLWIRGGIVATSLAYGAPDGLAASLGVSSSAAALFALDRFGTWDRGASVGVARRHLAFAMLALSASFLLRAVYLAVFPVIPEEAYYWMYGQHPDFGYLDHPPLVAWLIRLGQSTWGADGIGLRLGSLTSGVIVAVFVHRLARRMVDRESAWLAAALAATMPYVFFGSGLLITPDAPLAAAWAGALYFLHRALVGGEARSWYGAGIALGLGLLAKYTIVLLGAAASMFVLIDPDARRWLRRPEPYAAAVIAALLFTPVLWWNSHHDWMSFRFQTGDRYGAHDHAGLHVLVANILAVATPLPLLVLPLLFRARRPRREAHAALTAPVDPRNRLFIGCVVGLPLAVFVVNALSHVPRLNWTGPIWLALLPLLAWTVVHGHAIGSSVGILLQRWTARAIAGLVLAYGLCLYHVVLGLPGIPASAAIGRAVGWDAVAQALERVRMDPARGTGEQPFIVGMDKYAIAAELAYRLGRAADVTTMGAAFGSQGLMFTLWHPPASLAGRTAILVARDEKLLRSPDLGVAFASLDPSIRTLPLEVEGPGRRRTTVATCYYRLAYGYRPPAASDRETRAPLN